MYSAWKLNKPSKIDGYLEIRIFSSLGMSLRLLLILKLQFDFADKVENV